MVFKTIHTRTGLIAMAQAESKGEPINLTEMAVGDGNGLPVTPDWEMTQLTRERYRAPINRVYQSPDDPTQFTAELVVPTTEGGFTLRELAAFDANGDMFVIGNLPDIYMPASGEGAFADAVVRLTFVVSNAQVVSVMLDPAVAVASQAWVINNITAASLIPGGTVGQLLGKKTNQDGDVEWQNPAEVNVTVDTVAEKQLLADGQTIIDLNVTTTYGLAVYIEGLRIDIGSGPGEWQPDEALPTRLHLGQSYPAGTRATLVNNEPAGSAPAPLERGKNLADVLSKTEARANLDIFSKAETRQMAPAGMVTHFARATAPTGWLKANGAAVSRTAYAELFAAIGTSYGAGDGFTTFNLPDLRGEFLRGWDDGRGVDGGRALGSSQLGQIESHAHAASAAEGGAHGHDGSTSSAGAHNHAASTGAAGSHRHIMTGGYQGGYNNTYVNSDAGGGSHANKIPTSTDGNHTHPVSIGTAGAHSHSVTINTGGAHSHSITVEQSGGGETRPRNVALLACIKF